MTEIERAPLTVVVIGGNGHLGRAATQGAADVGAHVTVFSRNARRQDPRTVAVSGSITRVDDLRRVLDGVQAVVVSVEADWTAPGMQKVYVEGMRNVLATAPADAHIVFMGNIGVSDDSRMPEYNRAKRQAEDLLRRSGRRYTVLRPAWIVSGTTGAKLEQGDRYRGRRDDVSSDQLAKAIGAILTYADDSAGKTFELYGADQQVDWSRALKNLTKDE
jgi:uncharacterized protein YbjT (DUF2867 family)